LAPKLIVPAANEQVAQTFEEVLLTVQIADRRPRARLGRGGESGEEQGDDGESEDSDLHSTSYFR